MSSATWLMTLDLVMPGQAEGQERPAAVARGPEPAWEELIRRHDRRVVVALLARGLPVERARELAQDAWMRLVEQHRAGRLPVLKLPGVAIRQALFLAQDDRRREHRRAQKATRGPVATADLRAQLVARDELRRIEDVVARSSASTRRVFQALYGPSPRKPEEVARELGLSTQRVRQILCELRQRIRAELGDSPDA